MSKKDKLFFFGGILGFLCMCVALNWPEKNWLEKKKSDDFSFFKTTNQEGKYTYLRMHLSLDVNQDISPSVNQVTIYHYGHLMFTSKYIKEQTVRSSGGDMTMSPLPEGSAMSISLDSLSEDVYFPLYERIYSKIVDQKICGLSPQNMFEDKNNPNFYVDGTISLAGINHNITVRCLDGEGQPENTTILLSAVDQKIILSAFYQILGEAEKLAEKARKNNGNLLVYGPNGL